MQSSTHDRRILEALNTAVASLQRAAHSETAVYDTFCHHLQTLGLHGAISMLDETSTTLVVEALAIPTELFPFLLSLEKAMNMRGVGYAYPVELALIDQQVLVTGKSLYLPDNSEKLKQVLPDLAALGAQVWAGFSGLPGIVAPVMLDGVARGVLYVAGSHLRAGDAPAIEAFANQLALTLKDAHLFQAMRQTEIQYRRLFETAHDAILVIDVASRYILSANPRATLMTGHTEETLMGLTLDALLPPDLNPDVVRLPEVLQAQEMIITEGQLVRADGQILRVQFSASSFELKGRLLLQGFIRDVTEKRRQEALQTAVYQIATIANSTISLQDLYRSIHAIIGQLMDARNFYIAIYNRAENLLHLPYFVDEHDVYDGRFYKASTGLTEYVIHTGLPQLIDDETYEQLIRQGIVTQVGTRHKIWLGVPLKTSSEIFGAIVVQNYHDRSVFTEREKQFLAFVSGQIALAIERKRTETALQKLAAELEQQVNLMDVVLSTTPDFFFIYDLHGRHLYASPSALAAVQLTLAEVLGKTLGELKMFPDVAQEIEQGLQRVAQTGQVVTGELQVMQGGEAAHFEYFLHPVSDGNGRFTAIVATSRNFTQRKLAEEVLHHTQKIESLGVLAGGVAHDFNNLLVAIMGQSSLALSQLAPDVPAYTHVEKAVKAAERAAELTQQLLAYSGRGQFTVQPLLLEEVIRENRHFLDVAIPPHVCLNLDLNDAPSRIQADPGQIQQVVMNLILNAAEAIQDQPGTIWVSTRLQPISATDETWWRRTKQQLEPGNYVSLVVQDDGCGMDEETLNRIFDPFFTTKFTGRGLGLAAVLGIMRGHKGGVRVFSQPGLGTTFELLFPVTHRQPSPPAAKPVAGIKVAKTAVILVIDDEANVCDAVTDILELEGIAVLTALDGGAGIELYRQQADAIDLVLLDWSMPHMNGEQTFLALQRVNPNVRVVMSSGYSETETIPRSAGRPPIGFLQKPYTLNRLVAEITRYLSPDN